MPDTFTADQLVAAWDHNTQHLTDLSASVEGARNVVDHPAEVVLAQRLASELEQGDLPFCPHVPATPGRLVWTPGQPTLSDPMCGCNLEQRGSAAHRCHQCGADVDANEGAMLSEAGPVLVLSVICSTCSPAPPAASVPTELAEAVATVLRLLFHRWERTPA